MVPRLQVTLWWAYLREWDSCQETTLMAQRLGLSSIRSKMATSWSTSTSSLFSTSGLRTQKRLILISFVNHLAFRGAHIRICDAKGCKTGRWTIWIFIKVKIDRVKLLAIFNFLKIYSPGSLSEFDNHMTSQRGCHCKLRKFSYSLRFARHLFEYTRVIYP